MKDYTKVTAAERCKPTRTSFLSFEDFYTCFFIPEAISVQLLCAYT